MDALTQLKESLSDRYEIEREIGAGGMATVYLARDIRHDRHVALKLLNPDLGAVLGVERFLAEIRVTANLQHPNLLPLFDSGAAEGGLLYYVMPYVEGESLRARLDREKQLPIDESLRIAIAIANALDYAHSHGVIHRDLKPENILLQAGQPVIADFGIALAVSKAGGNRITQTGVSLGTPQYMSPEQATGDRVIDGRSDIYSLAAVIYEMLTGDPPHIGSTSQAIIARVLTEKPRSMRSIRPAIPEYVELAVQHALEKLPADRFANAREFAEAMSGRGPALTTGVVSDDRRRWREKQSFKAWLLNPLTLMLAAVAFAAIAFAALRKPAAPPSRAVRFVITASDSSRPPADYGGPWPGAITRDGGTVVYVANGGAGPVLYSLRTDQLDPRQIPGTNGAYQPVFSPDGEWICFETQGKVNKVRLDGSEPISISAGGAANGADWTTLDEIILGSEATRRGLSRLSSSGGEPIEFVKPDKSKGETDYLWPIAFPDGKAVVFAVWTGRLTTTMLALASVDGGDVAYLGIRGIRPLALVNGKLIYVQADGAIMGVAIDESARKVNGRPVAVYDPVVVIAGYNGNSSIFISAGGAMVASRGGLRSQLSWIARDGRSIPITKEARRYASPSLSPDGRRIAVAAHDRDTWAIWIHDAETGTFSRFSSVAVTNGPWWSPNGSKIFYVGTNEKDRLTIWSQQADGGASPEKVVDVGFVNDLTVAPDGRSLVYAGYNNNSWDLLRVRLDSAPVVSSYLASPDADEQQGRFSPDGRWVAAVSTDTGINEVYVLSYPNPSLRVQVSTGAALSPVWSRDGSSVYYVAGAVLMSARISTSPSLRVVSRDTVLTDVSALVNGYDVAKDGRLLGLVSQKNDYQLVVVPNWRVELERKFAAAQIQR